ncbi:MAG: glycosyltransferase family 39 protein [Candidatus Palauibacterales bacterium]|nr:glycosyltransferase family 39 protein [Candidatus Palauibacterales bacterium]MDP2583952.1 glycosyltransferase family 39 protein [Candidatus Palauibacterales bacterium]
MRTESVVRRSSPDAGRLASGAAAWCRRLLGAALLVVPLLPLRILFGPYEDVGKLVDPGQWILGAAIVGAVAWLLSLPELPEPFLRRIGARGRRLEDRVRGVCLVLLAVMLIWVSWSVFRHRPLLVDSIAQLFQAKIFASGRFTAPAPADPAFFVTQNMVLDSGRWYAQYPPGQAALLVPGVLAGVPWLVPIVLSLVSAVALHAFARRVYDPATARVTLFLLVLCPFFLFMGASFMNHVPTLAFISVFLWLFARWDADGGALALAGAGAALGAAFLCRPFTVAAVAVPFAMFGLSASRRSGRWADLAAGAAGFLVLAGGYPFYDLATTGHAFLTGYVEQWGASHGLGFHETPWGTTHTPLLGLRNELTDVQLLNLNLFEWPIPALWPAAGALLAGWLRDRWSGRLLTAFVAIPAAYFFYWHRDSYLGPRFLFAGVAFIVPLTARTIVLCARRLGGIDLQVASLFRPVSARRLALTAAAIAIGWSIAVGIPGRHRVYATGLMSLKRDLPAEARAAGIDSGLIFVKVAAGSRLIARLRGLGASASSVERGYRRSDFCDLLTLERRARAGRWSQDRLETALRRTESSDQDLVRDRRLNGDPTLRLRRDRFGSSLHLPPDCLDELEYDGTGYGLFTPFLLVDRPDLDGLLVVAIDQRGLNRELEARYPDRAAYLYRDGHFEPVSRTGLRGRQFSPSTGPPPPYPSNRTFATEGRPGRRPRVAASPASLRASRRR